jgi:hypothetical protein
MNAVADMQPRMNARVEVMTASPIHDDDHKSAATTSRQDRRETEPEWVALGQEAATIALSALARSRLVRCD